MEKNLKMADLETESWQEMLKENPLFEHLRLSSTEREGRRNVMCEIRGDLFVWSSHDSALLTTNLKRMVAHPMKELVFQELKPTHSIGSSVVRLLPDPSGQYIAIQCEHGVSVMTLHHHRGELGEFGGGIKQVMCTVVSIARDFFAIHRPHTPSIPHDPPTPTLLQAAWHPSAPFHLAVLTKDCVLRVYSLADPDVEVLSLALPSSPTPGGFGMKDRVVAFSLWENMAFVLQDEGMVTLTPLTPRNQPPPPLLMHPQVDDDCDDEPVAMLVLPSNPCVVVIATAGGLLSHCVYLMDSDEEEVRGVSGPSNQCLYIVESISFDTGDSATFPSSLINDPLNPHVYYIVHSEGVHQVTLPWLLDIEQYASTETDSPTPLNCLAEDKRARVDLLLQTEPGTNWIEGSVVVSESMLGLTVIGLTSDWECMVLPLQRYEPVPVPARHHLSPRRLNPAPQSTGGDFEEVIRSILQESAKSSIASYTDKEMSQEECFGYLSEQISRLRRERLLQQRLAKEKMKQKIASLQKQKQDIVSERVRIEDDISELASVNYELQDKIAEVQQTCKSLGSRANTLLCKLEAQSPVLSQAEEWMRDEIEGFRSHLPLMRQRLLEAHRKLEISCGPGHTPKVDISGTQSKTILETLLQSGKSIKKLTEQVQGLKDAVQGPTGS